jgi:tRNA dimethylallyltransferase
MKLAAKNKIICIVGPTASGKTGLAVKLAYFLQGEIISADSRQVYKYMDIGTGKDLDEYRLKIKNKKINIPYHLINIAHPNTLFDLAKYVNKAKIAINDIQKRKGVPVITGGTGLYVQALVDGYDLSPVKPDKELRKELEDKTVKQLLAQLKRTDFKKFNGLNNSEQNNKRRLIRYIEIAKNRGRGKGKRKKEENKSRPNFLVIGAYQDREILKKLIKRRLLERLEKEDMIGEVKRLHRDHRVSWQRLIDFGLEYKYIALHLRGELDYTEMVDKLYTAICQFAKRQMSWYRRWEKQGQKIYWINNYKEAKIVINKNTD